MNGNVNQSGKNSKAENILLVYLVTTLSLLDAATVLHTNYLEFPGYDKGIIWRAGY